MGCLVVCSRFFVFWCLVVCTSFFFVADCFRWLLHPFAPEAFVRDHLEQKPLHISRGDPEYYRKTFSMENVSAIVDSWERQGSPFNVTDDFGLFRAPEFVAGGE